MGAQARTRNRPCHRDDEDVHRAAVKDAAPGGLDQSLFWPPRLGGQAKYTLETLLELPRDKVIELFTNPDNMASWQPRLLSFDLPNVAPGHKGAIFKLKHKIGGRVIEMTETLESESLPEELAFIYEAKCAWNRVVNRFLKNSPTQTKWVFETEFRCTGFLRILALIMPRMFKNESQKDMQRFKEFAESQSIND